jgi:hypothetical protein
LADIQFKNDKVLFLADKVSFCPDDCSCRTAHDPPPRPPTDPGGGSEPSPCPGLTHTPGQIKLTKTASPGTFCKFCADGTSISVPEFPGEYILTQDPGNPCRWTLDTAFGSGSAQIFDAPGCGSTVTLSTSLLRFVMEWVGDGFTLVVSFVYSPTNSTVVFSGKHLAADWVPTFSVTSNLFGDYCLDSTAGSKVTWPGSIDVEEVTGGVTTPCTCTTSPTCLMIGGFTDLTTCPDFTVCDSEVDSDCQRLYISLPNTASCTWAAAATKAGGVTDVAADLIYDAAGSLGCGYYLTLKAGSTSLGTYFQSSEKAYGRYRLVDSTTSGLPIELQVTTLCEDCTDPDFPYLSSVVLNISDPVHAGYSGDINGIRNLALSTNEYTSVVDGVDLKLACDAFGWYFDISLTSGLDTYGSRFRKAFDVEGPTVIGRYQFSNRIGNITPDDPSYWDNSIVDIS